MPFVQLTVFCGDREGQSLKLGPGQTMSVGRLASENGFAVADPFMAPVHFVLKCDSARCTLHDASSALARHPRCRDACFLHQLRGSVCPEGVCAVHDRSGENGVHLNHRPVQESVLDDGDVIVAGTTGFKVQRSDVPFPRTDVDELSHPGAQRQSERAFSRLSELRLPRFAVLDAARSPIVRKLLLTYPELSFSLYDGLEGERLGEAAPYLVELPIASQLAEVLVREHWGQGYGCFLFSPGDFKTVRRHLRQFLVVQDAQHRRVYFRFYDPRVLSVFLKNLRGEDCAAFFGPVAYFLTESDRPDVGWLFRRDHDQTYQEAVRFD